MQTSFTQLTGVQEQPSGSPASAQATGWHASMHHAAWLKAYAACLCPLCTPPVVLQALAAHLLNLWDKTLLFRASAAQSGCSTPRQLLLLLGIRASARLSLPVLKENISKVLRGTGGAGAGLGATIHLSSAEEVPDDDSDAVSLAHSVSGSAESVAMACGGKGEQWAVPDVASPRAPLDDGGSSGRYKAADSAVSWLRLSDAEQSLFLAAAKCCSQLVAS